MVQFSCINELSLVYLLFILHYFITGHLQGVPVFPTQWTVAPIPLSIISQENYWRDCFLRTSWPLGSNLVVALGRFYYLSHQGSLIATEIDW